MNNAQSLQTGDVIRRTFQVVVGNFPQLAAITMIVYIPLFLLLAYMFSVMTPEQLASEPADLGVEDARAGCLLLLLTLVAFILTQIQSGAFAFGVFEALRGRPIRIGRCFRVAASRLIHMILAAFLVVFCFAGGLILFVIPGFMVLVGLSVVIPVVVVERLGLIESLKRSWELTDGNKWRIFVLALLWVLVSAAVSVLLEQFELGGIWVEQALEIGLSFFSATGITLIYHDLRQIKDGLGTDDLVAVFE